MGQEGGGEGRGKEREGEGRGKERVEERECLVDEVGVGIEFYFG